MKKKKVKKVMKIVVLLMGILSMSFLFNSCLDDDGYSLDNYWLGVSTVESINNNQHYFKLDDGTTLYPASGSYLGHNLNDGQRTWLNYTILSDSLSGFDHYIKINGVDPILTKKIAEDLDEKNDSVYGTDQVKVENIWIGDGYLNMIFTFNYGGMKKHFVNLLSVSDQENAYRVEFRHNAYDDPPLTSVASIVCFDLSELPDTEGETVKLTVEVNTFSGDKTYELDYNSDKELITDRDPSGFDFVNFERVN